MLEQTIVREVLHKGEEMHEKIGKDEKQSQRKVECIATAKTQLKICSHHAV